MELKAYVFECEYENTLDGAVVISESKEKAIKHFKELTDYTKSDWMIKEGKLEEGVVL